MGIALGAAGASLLHANKRVGSATNGSQRCRLRILILGGGFAGCYPLHRLKKGFRHNRGIEITLINRENYMLFTSLLHEVAANDLDAADIVNPLHRLVHRAGLLSGEVRHINLGPMYTLRKQLAFATPSSRRQLTTPERNWDANLASQLYATSTSLGQMQHPTSRSHLHDCLLSIPADLYLRGQTWSGLRHWRGARQKLADFRQHYIHRSPQCIGPPGRSEFTLPTSHVSSWLHYFGLFPESAQFRAGELHSALL